MGDHQNGLFTHGVLQQVIEDLVGSVVVQGRQGIIQQHDITTKVSSTGQVQALALTTRQVDTTQASLAHVTLGQDLQVQLQTTVMDDLGIALLIKGSAKQDVITQGQVLAPPVLRAVGDLASTTGLTLLQLHVAKGSLDQGRLARAHTANNSHQLTRADTELWYIQDKVFLSVMSEAGIALQKEAQQASLVSMQIMLNTVGSHSSTNIFPNHHWERFFRKYHQKASLWSILSILSIQHRQAALS
jgi:hypothetical protein